MKKFIRRKLQHIKESTDTSDLAGMEECFLQQTMDMDEAVGMMKVNLVNSGMRSPKEMLKHYGKVGTKKMVPVKEVGADGKTVEVQLSVEEKIRRWMMWKYADEIDCVIVKTEEEVRKPSTDPDSDQSDAPRLLLPSCARELVLSVSVPPARLRVCASVWIIGSGGR